jgi:hypothetical protein
MVAGLGACAFALLAASPLALAAPLAPVTIHVDEVIVVSDAPLVLPPVAISFTERITISDTALVLPPVVISFAEGISISDTPTTVVSQPPTAVNHSYLVMQDTALTVAVPGVLANDTAPAGTTLTARLVGSPTRGTLVLHDDGSFNYTPAAGFSGTDSFTYRAVNGNVDSNLATVTITVLASGGGGGGDGGGGVPPDATPELDSLLLFGSGLSGLAGYGLLRLRTRKRRDS